MENIGYFLLVIVALCWLAAVFAGMIAAFPYGIIGFVAIAGFGFLFVKIIKDRLTSKEDDYYSNNVEQ